MGGPNDENPYLVLPGTPEYDALAFLVRNRGEQFTLPEIAASTDMSEADAADTMTNLFEDDLVERSQGAYYVPVERAEDLQRRLESVDAAAKLHENAPDDAYAVDGWEEQVDSL
ncbi:MarR family transcriptional regulator [Halobacterium salinarum]|uniref:MarR family transcriptional regulator n=1 Tax=Halobacterium salinarum TaxID=2242 RepID=UPI001F23DAA4|nr:MarR family transcriptional regulator [Halobacterium salinarum]MCF2165375.1 MarR family transcriptional regulator [Halobacterium salinarum]MCF2168235.1 MarR family transcriptional regulator [Halobacterium salinarum]